MLEEVLRNKKISPMLGDRIDDDTVVVHPSERGRLKQALLKVGWPAEDLAGYVDGEAHAIELDQADWQLRDYQADAVEGVLARRLRRRRAARAARARRSSAPPRWRGPARRR